MAEVSSESKDKRQNSFIIHGRAERRVFQPWIFNIGPWPGQDKIRTGLLPFCFISCLLIYERQQRLNYATPIFLSKAKGQAGDPPAPFWGTELFYDGGKAPETALKTEKAHSRAFTAVYARPGL